MYRILFTALALAATGTLAAAEETPTSLTGTIQHVLLISIDGMHSLDFTNCAKGVPGVNNGSPYCPQLAQLSKTGLVYTQAFTPKVSDSFPGLMALITGGTPASTGVWYDVSYDRSLNGPATATPGGIAAGACPAPGGTQVAYDESIDIDSTQLNGGGGINTQFLPRDPNNGCAPVWPHSFLKVNTVFEVARAAKMYTAWSDKHPAYDIVNGPSGKGVVDLYTPEINSYPVNLPNVSGCSPLPDPANAGSGHAWTDSFTNIICYDGLKVQAVINEINGKTHSGGATAPVPAIFGMNFQSVSVNQKLSNSTATGGYLDSLGTPTPQLLNAIQSVDGAIGQMAAAIQKAGLAGSTVIIVTAKHGQSSIDPNRITRIPADVAGQAPSDVLGGIGSGYPGGGLVGQADEDDASLIWLTDQTQVASSVSTLEKNEAAAGAGEIFSGPSVNLFFSLFQNDTRSPDIVVAPNVGVVYTGKKKKIAEHGGPANDDRNVMLLVANPAIPSGTFRETVETRQVALTILKLLGLSTKSLQAPQMEPTSALPALPY